MPTVIEGGVADYEATSWIGLVVPVATDGAIIARLAAALAAAMHTRDVADILVRDGTDIVASSPAEFRRVIEDDHAKYAKLASLFKAAKP